MNINKAYEYIENCRDKIVEDIKALAKIPSISKSGVDSYPFGEEVNKALLKSAELFNESGFNMEVKSDKGYAVAVLEGEGDGIGLFGHADVVPVNNDWIKTSPFEPIQEDGILYGRGVSDNKAGVIGSLYALRALKAAGIDLKSRITVYVGGSEETGMQDIAGFVESERMPEVNIIPDSDFPVSVGEKGILHIALKSKNALSDVKCFEGGQAYNVILDNVKVAVLDNEPYSVLGLTAHAAHPEGSENAAYKAAQELCSSNSICQNDKQILSSFKTLIEGYYGENLGIASEGAFGKLTCVNGIVKLIEDGNLYFTLDIRYGSEVDSKKAIESIKNTANKHGFEIDELTDDGGFLLDENSKATQIILNACREFSGIKDAQPYKTYGGTYARKLKNAYAIDHCLPYDKTALNLPKGHGGAHQSDEALSIEHLIGGIKTLALIIKELDEHLTK